MNGELKGVWVVITQDYVEIVDKVFLTEIEALRVINEQGYGKVRFLEFGKSLTDA